MNKETFVLIEILFFIAGYFTGTLLNRKKKSKNVYTINVPAPKSQK